MARAELSDARLALLKLRVRLETAEANEETLSHEITELVREPRR
jgi:hypothetical protein